MATLNILSSDVLDRIISYLSPALITLWLTGNKILLSKLASGCTELSLRAPKALAVDFPLALLELRSLRRLSLTSDKPLLRDPTRWPGIIQRLPRTLEMLCICSTDSRLALANFSPDWTISTPKYIETDHSRGKSRFLSLETLFPRLHTLHVTSFQNIRTIENRDFPGLPPTLTCLKAIINIETYEESGPHPLAMLPPSLKRIEGRVTLNWDTAPQPGYLDAALPLLEHFSLTSQHSKNRVDWLPRSLLSLGNGFRVVSWNSAIAKSIPPLLRSLTMGLETRSTGEGWEWASSLPRHLTTLNLDYCNATSFSLGDLPRTLRSLSSIRLDLLALIIEEKHNLAPGEDFFSLWPPGLTYLHFQLPRTGSIDFLPPTLTKIEVQIASDVKKPVDAYFLPPKLTSLSFRINRGSGPDDHKTLEIRGKMPASLTKHERLELDPVGQRVFAHLHPSLSHLSCNRMWSPLSAPVQLPMLLESLELFYWHREWLSLLPRSLKTLKISDLQDTEESPAVMNGDLFEALPPTLTFLLIAKMGPVPHLGPLPVGNLSMTQQALQALPAQRFPAALSSLTELHFSPVIRSSFVRELPQCLQSVNIVLESLDEEDAPYIPQHLAFFSPGPKIKYKEPHVAQYWPPRSYHSIHWPNEEVSRLVELRFRQLNR